MSNLTDGREQENKAGGFLDSGPYESSETRLSFSMEFCRDDDIADLPISHLLTMRTFNHYFSADDIHFAPHIYGVDGIDFLDCQQDDKFILCNSNLDAENFGSSDQPSNKQTFLNFACTPCTRKTFRSNLVLATDAISPPEYKTTEDTTLTIRVENASTDKYLSPLALALNSEDATWFSKSGRPFGRLFKDEAWVKGVLKDIIVQRFIQEDLPIDEKSSSQEWAAALEHICSLIIDEGYEPSTWISKDLRYAEFSHIGGKDYDNDFLSILDVADAMNDAFEKSCHQNPSLIWKDEEMAEKLRDFINFILMVKSDADALTIKKSSRSTIPAFQIILGDKTIGKISQFSSGKPKRNEFDDCLVQVGHIAAYVSSGINCKTTAALLHHRISASPA